MTNTTETIGGSHQHNFSAQGKCSCGKTFDQWRAEHEAANEAAQNVQAPAAAPAADNNDETTE